MGGDGSHTPVGIGIQMCKLIPILLRHTLHLQGQDAQTVEHLLYTRRQHSQIFGTCQHLRIPKDRRQLACGLPCPEVLMPLIIVTVVQAHERFLLFLVKDIIDRLVVHTVSRMVHSFLVDIFQEQHIHGQTVQSVTYPQRILIMPLMELLTYLFL